ncbi:hypothetical protein [Thalassomonas sp. M1454]|uniref:hypothetical protein n=1 Tax=Thalassomonas sp. M1454 TaxID=2594477 RepID=UPI00117DDF5C|nr:hypothetical protein [Thalassomonas sp. M1454]TRX53454.1 hypothetical protein FNN08_14365 [Thalassomonas sp. M1454]
MLDLPKIGSKASKWLLGPLAIGVTGYSGMTNIINARNSTDATAHAAKLGLDAGVIVATVAIGFISAPGAVVFGIGYLLFDLSFDSFGYFKGKIVGNRQRNAIRNIRQ